MLHRVTYQAIQSSLQHAKCAFTIVEGKGRHQPSDVLTFDDSLLLEPNCAFLVGSSICSMGSFSYSWSVLPVYAKIGRFCSIARGLNVLGVRHPYEWVTTSSMTYDGNFCIFKDTNRPIRTRPSKPTKLHISDDVWIGQNVSLASALTIGRGAVIAADSMVVKDVKPYEIVGGNPACHIKWRFPQETIQALEASKWWTYHPSLYAHLDMTNPLTFAAAVIQESAQHDWPTYLPDQLTAKKLIGA